MSLGAAVSHVCTGSKGIIGKIPGLSWIPAIGYIVFDVADKFKKGEDGTGKNQVSEPVEASFVRSFCRVLHFPPL